MVIFSRLYSMSIACTEITNYDGHTISPKKARVLRRAMPRMGAPRLDAKRGAAAQRARAGGSGPSAAWPAARPAPPARAQSSIIRRRPACDSGRGGAAGVRFWSGLHPSLRRQVATHTAGVATPPNKRREGPSAAPAHAPVPSAAGPPRAVALASASHSCARRACSPAPAAGAEPSGRSSSGTTPPPKAHPSAHQRLGARGAQLFERRQRHHDLLDRVHHVGRRPRLVLALESEICGLDVLVLHLGVGLVGVVYVGALVQHLLELALLLAVWGVRGE